MLRRAYIAASTAGLHPHYGPRKRKASDPSPDDTMAYSEVPKRARLDTPRNLQPIGLLSIRRSLDRGFVHEAGRMEVDESSRSSDTGTMNACRAPSSEPCSVARSGVAEPLAHVALLAGVKRKAASLETSMEGMRADREYKRKRTTMASSSGLKYTRYSRWKALELGALVLSWEWITSAVTVTMLRPYMNSSAYGLVGHGSSQPIPAAQSYLVSSYAFPTIHWLPAAIEIR